MISFVILRYIGLLGERADRGACLFEHTHVDHSPLRVRSRSTIAGSRSRGSRAGRTRGAPGVRRGTGPRSADRDRQSKLSRVSINTVELLKTQTFGDCWSWFTIFITYNKQYIYRWISFYELLPPLSEPPRSACSSAGAWTEAGTPPRRAWPISTSFLRRIH